MGDYSRDGRVYEGSTFDPDKHYVAVRMQQGVPLVDADWNEMNDVTRHEMYDGLDFLFSGGGVIAGTASLNIVPAGNWITIPLRPPLLSTARIFDELPNDFAIGNGAILVQGRLLKTQMPTDKTIGNPDYDPVMSGVILTPPPFDYFRYSSQHGIPTLTTPSSPRTDLVYLDVWEQEVLSTLSDPAHGDPQLVHPAIGLETCARLQRRFVVRVREGVPDDTKAVPENIKERHHIYVPLALLNFRQKNDAIVRKIEDIRPNSGMAMIDNGRVIIKGQDTSELGLRVCVANEADGPPSAALFVAESNASDDVNKVVAQFYASTRKHLIGSFGLAYCGTFTKHPLGLFTANTERLRITEDGKVGVGTLAPTTSLHVKGRISSDKGEDGNFGGAITLYSGDESPSLHMDNASGILRISHGKSPGANQILDISANGSVVIGTPSLEYNLIINGWITVTERAFFGGPIYMIGVEEGTSDRTNYLRFKWDEGNISKEEDVLTIKFETPNIKSITVHDDWQFKAKQKHFQIDHPVFPSDKFLNHACLEGPEAGVYYRGEAQLAKGYVTVSLPNYFEALTRKDNRTVLLTPKFEDDEPISMLAASEVKDGQFKVRAIDDKNPSQMFYWEVKAVRADVPLLEVERNKTTG